MTVTGKCDVPKCKRRGVITYYGKDVCEKHWEMHCRENCRFDLKDKLGIRRK